MGESEIEIDNVDQSLRDWANSPINQTEFVRQNASKLGVDSNLYLAGWIIRTVQDDGNLFGNLSLPKEFANLAPKPSLVRELYGNRLNFEISAPETPESVRAVLNRVQTALPEKFDLDEDQVRARDLWEQAKREISTLAETDPEIERALEYQRREYQFVNLEFSSGN